MKDNVSLKLSFRTSAIIEDQLAAMERRITASAERIAELEGSRPNGDHDAVRSDPRKSGGRGSKLCKSTRSSKERQSSWMMDSVVKRTKKKDVSASSETDRTWSNQASDNQVDYTDNDELNGKIHEGQ